jgi:gag-polypeptide of LTR copia-type
LLALQPAFAQSFLLAYKSISIFYLSPIIILATVETQEVEKEKLKKNKKFEFRNNVGYSELLLLVFDDISFCIVYEAKTEDQPHGGLFMAWKGLMDIFEPSTPSRRLALKKKSQKSTLTSVDVDPDVWITELELLRKCLKSLKVNIEDKAFVMQLLINNLPIEYDSLVEALKKI